MVVFGILIEHLRNEIGLPNGRGKLVDDELAMVPDLVVLLVGQSRFIKPLEFVVQIGVDCLKDLGTVEPGMCVLASRLDVSLVQGSCMSTRLCSEQHSCR